MPHLDPAEVRIGGRGVFLMRKLMDELSCQPRGERGNTLRMVKRCPCPRASGAARGLTALATHFPVPQPSSVSSSSPKPQRAARNAFAAHDLASAPSGHRNCLNLGRRRVDTESRTAGVSN